MTSVSLPGIDWHPPSANPVNAASPTIRNILKDTFVIPFSYWKSGVQTRSGAARKACNGGHCLAGGFHYFTIIGQLAGKLRYYLLSICQHQSRNSFGTIAF
jgi:hypothetical protein